MCGIFGIWNHKNAVNYTYLGLFALQHRGQESAGITVVNDNQLDTYKKMGLVSDIFTPEVLKKLEGISAIGHVRYSTTGISRIENAQPITVTYHAGQVSLVHNGNLVNADWLRQRLEQEGAVFHSTSDSEVIIQLVISMGSSNLYTGIIKALPYIKGAYSVIILTPKELIGIRDIFGFRPLCLGIIDDSYVLASESCAFDLIGAKYIRDIEPGEIVVINHNGISSHKSMGYSYSLLDNNVTNIYRQCIFEYIYFARPDSKVFGENVYKVRKQSGRILAKEAPVDADIVIPIPDSGVSSALGYAEECNIKYELGLIRNHYIGRTFIDPEQSIREIGVSIKLNPVYEIVANKRVIVIDDSIVRGTTCKKIIKMLKEADVQEIHLRISSPPIKYPCFYGVDTPTSEELIAATHTLNEIRDFIGVDTLQYLSIDGLLSSVGFSGNNDRFCIACFNGDYPIT